MSPPNISFIVPYASRSWCSQDERLTSLLRLLCSIPDTEVLLHVSGNLSTLEQQQLVAFDTVRMFQQEMPPIYSAGQARNAAVHHANGEYLFFIDVDLLIHPNLAYSLVTRAQQLKHIGITAFEMFPCLYLNQAQLNPAPVSELISVTKREDSLFDLALSGYMKGEYSVVEGIALASSCLLVNRQWFIQIGGFDPLFVGHGGEDLELIHRLCLHYPLPLQARDYPTNHKTRFVADYLGFRRYMACYALAHLFKKRFLLHQWHPRPLTHDYHRVRHQNDRQLEQKVLLTNNITPPLTATNIDCPNDIKQFVNWIKHVQTKAGYPPNRYPGLFRLADEETIPRPIMNKLRKLYLNPTLFFSDAKLNFKKRFTTK